jgi:hypothetical protein
MGLGALELVLVAAVLSTLCTSVSKRHPREMSRGADDEWSEPAASE